MWVESGDAFTAAKYEPGSVSPAVVAGYTAAEAAALVIDPLPVGATYQTHPTGYLAKALSFAPGQFLRVGGLNLEDPAGYPQFPPAPKKSPDLVAPWERLPDRRPLRSQGYTVYAPGGTGGSLLAVLKAAPFSGAICLARFFALRHGPYVRGESWTVTRTDLLSLWLYGDGSVGFCQGPGPLDDPNGPDTPVLNSVTGRPARSAPGAFPFNTWFRLQMGAQLDYTRAVWPLNVALSSTPGPDVGEARLVARVNTTDVLGSLTAGGDANVRWQTNPWPGASWAQSTNPGQFDPDQPPLGVNGFDFGACSTAASPSTGTVVMRDVVLLEGLLPYHYRNWAVTHVLPTVDTTPAAIATYNADPGNTIVFTYTDRFGARHTVDTGLLRRRPWRRFKSGGTLASGGAIDDPGAVDLTTLQQWEVWRDQDGNVQVGGPPPDNTWLRVGYKENNDEDSLAVGDGRACFYGYAMAALAAACGWDPLLASGVEWLTVTPYRDNFQNNRDDQHFVLLWPEDFWLEQIPNHTVAFWWTTVGIGGGSYGLEMDQARRDRKTFFAGYTRFRGQPGLDDQPVVVSSIFHQFTAPGGLDWVQTCATAGSTMILHQQSGFRAAGAQADVLHMSPYTPPMVIAPPLDYHPPAHQSATVLLVDSFGHYAGDSATPDAPDTHLGGATTYDSPVYGAGWPCYGFAQYQEYGAKSAKWPTALGDVTIVRPGRRGADGALRVVGSASCVARSLADVDGVTPFEPQLGFHWHAETPGDAWDADYVRLATCYKLGDLSQWPPQLQLTLEVDRQGYLHVNRTEGAFAGLPPTARAAHLVSTNPIADVTVGAYIELRAALASYTLIPSYSYVSGGVTLTRDPQVLQTLQGYVTLMIDGDPAGTFVGQPTVLDPLDSLHATPAPPWVAANWTPQGDPRGTGCDFLVLGGDFWNPNGSHTVASVFDDFILLNVVDAEPPTADPGTAPDLASLPAEFYGDLQIRPLLPIATTTTAGSWTLAGAATAEDAVNQALPDGDTTTLRGAADGTPGAPAQLLFQYPHVPEPGEQGTGAERLLRFLGFQPFVVGRAEGPSSGSLGLTRPDANMTHVAVSSPDGAMDQPTGWRFWKTWHQPYEQLSIAPFVYWQPGTQDYGLTAHQFNALRIGPAATADTALCVMTQWGVEVIAAPPPGVRPRSWAFLL